MADLTPELLAQLEHVAADLVRCQHSTAEVAGVLDVTYAPFLVEAMVHAIFALPALVAAAKERDQLRAERELWMRDRDEAAVERDTARQLVDKLEEERDQLRAEVAAHDEQIAAIMDGTFAQGDGSAQKEIERLRAEVTAMVDAHQAAGETSVRHLRERDTLAAHVRSLLACIDRKSYSSAAQQEAVRAAEAAIGGVP